MILIYLFWRMKFSSLRKFHTVEQEVILYWIITAKSLNRSVNKSNISVLLVSEADAIYINIQTGWKKAFSTKVIKRTSVGGLCGNEFFLHYHRWTASLNDLNAAKLLSKNCYSECLPAVITKQIRYPHQSMAIKWFLPAVSTSLCHCIYHIKYPGNAIWQENMGFDIRPTP